MYPINVEDFPDIEVEELEELQIYSAVCASSWSCAGSRALAQGLPVQPDCSESGDHPY
jgi:hypothetical protein